MSNNSQERIWLASPKMHNEELQYIQDAFNKNWITTIGENINVAEKQICEKLGCKYAIALNSGTSVLHLAVKLAAQEIYGKPKNCELSLIGKQVFCSDMTYLASANPILYEGGKPIFIDCEYETWNMDAQALELAFKKFPDVKIVVVAHLYGTPSNLDEIIKVCNANNAILIEDAAESFGATFNGQQTATFGKYNCISFNGNKIITGSSGGMLITNDKDAYYQTLKWATQAREKAPWYEHIELGYNYRMSNIIAGIVRGQILHLEDHIQQKKDIYYRYKEGFKDLPVQMNPHLEYSEPNYWLSCLTINPDAMCPHNRTQLEYTYKKQAGKSCPDMLWEKLGDANIQSRPVWKPLHTHEYYANCHFISINENSTVEDIFDRGICLPSDINMNKEEQNRVIETIKNCFE